MKQRILVLVLTGIILMSMTACGGTTNDEVSVDDSKEEVVVNLGTPLEVLDAIYNTAELDADLKEQVENGAFGQMELDETSESMFLGATSVSYKSGAVSAPMMSSIAYQVVVLELEDGEDIEAIKKELVDTADTTKWVCVVPEKVVAESNGNYVLFIMADTITTDALVAAFLEL